MRLLLEDFQHFTLKKIRAFFFILLHVAPIFSLPIYTVSLPEDAEIGTLVTKVHATDVDIGINRKINYTFIDSFNEHFNIISDSGIITLAKPLDREGEQCDYFVD